MNCPSPLGPPTAANNSTPGVYACSAVPLNGRTICAMNKCYFVCHPGFVIKGLFSAICTTGQMVLSELPRCESEWRRWALEKEHVHKAIFSFTNCTMNLKSRALFIHFFRGPGVSRRDLLTRRKVSEMSRKHLFPIWKMHSVSRGNDSKNRSYLDGRLRLQ